MTTNAKCGGRFLGGLVLVALLGISLSAGAAEGDLAWAGRIGDTGQDFSYSVSLDGDGNVYTAGNFAGTDPSTGTYNFYMQDHLTNSRALYDGSNRCE